MQSLDISKISQKLLKSICIRITISSSILINFWLMPQGAKLFSNQILFQWWWFISISTIFCHFFPGVFSKNQPTIYSNNIEKKGRHLYLLTSPLPKLPKLRDYVQGWSCSGEVASISQIRLKPHRHLRPLPRPQRVEDLQLGKFLVYLIISLVFGHLCLLLYCNMC